MREVSGFMYYNDQEPPHFHVRNGEQKAIIAIDTLSERLFIRGGITWEFDRYTIGC